MWMHISTPRGDYSFDFDSKKDLDESYNALVQLLRQDMNGAGYMQLVQSKSSVVILSTELLRQSIIQIGGIK